LWGFAHDPKFSLCHTLSLRRSHRSTPVEIKLHHYQGVFYLDTDCSTD
jgi:hypothetical protein